MQFCCRFCFDLYSKLFTCAPATIRVGVPAPEVHWSAIYVTCTTHSQYIIWHLPLEAIIRFPLRHRTFAVHSMTHTHRCVCGSAAACVGSHFICLLFSTASPCSTPYIAQCLDTRSFPQLPVFPYHMVREQHAVCWPSRTDLCVTTLSRMDCV